MNRTQRKIKKEYRESLQEHKIIKDSDLYELRHAWGSEKGRAFESLKRSVEEERYYRRAMRTEVNRAESQNKEAATI